jgi:cellulose synthase/poly-beta-1,6-N-acetylglucosamine synthase-like glycosyltransferase
MAGTRRPDELVVVVRDIDTDTAAALDAWLAEGKLLPGIELRRPIATRPGQIVAMNCGLAAATCDVVCFIDDDCMVRPDWLERLAAHYDDPAVGGVGGRDLVHEEGTVLRGEVNCVGQISWYGRMVGNHHLDYTGSLTEVDHLKGANMSFRRALLRPFDERMSGGSSCLNDTDASLHVRAQGFRLLYDPALVVDHYPAQRFDTSTRVKTDPNLVYSDSHNWVYCMFKHLGPLRRGVFLAYALLVGGGTRYGLLKWLRLLPRDPRGATVQFLASTRGKLAGWRTWRRARRESACGDT